jgi:hypothetical protein
MRASNWTRRAPIQSTRRVHLDPWRERFAWSVAAVAIVAATPQFVILPPEKTPSFSPDAQTLAISPNGRSIVFAAAATGEATRLWVRPLDSLVATVLAGTEDARMPFWSPDSASVGLFAGGKLKRVAVQGGPFRRWPMWICRFIWRWTAV